MGVTLAHIGLFKKIISYSPPCNPQSTTLSTPRKNEKLVSRLQVLFSGTLNTATITIDNSYK